MLQSPVFHPMSSKTKTNRDLCVRVLLRFKQVTGKCQEL